MPKKESATQSRKTNLFRGFRSPTTTPIPDEVFDELLPDLTGAEIKVLLYVCRRTFGFKKESDSISLNQIATGIMTRGGRVLDRGTGLSKRHVQRALKNLESKNILKVDRRIVEDGVNETNVYALKIIDLNEEVGTLSPYGRDKRFLGVGTPVSTTTNSIQQTDVVVINALKKFKIEEEKAVALTAKYPPEYIEEKIAFLEWKTDMRTRGRPISDPAAWLIRAIEKDYEPPPEFRSHAQQMEVPENGSSGGFENGEGGQGHVEELRLKYGTTQEDNDLWQQVLEDLKGSTTRATYQAWFPQTQLLSLNDNRAIIGVPDQATREWLTDRLSPIVRRALEAVMGRDIDVEFVVPSDRTTTD